MEKSGFFLLIYKIKTTMEFTNEEFEKILEQMKVYLKNITEASKDLNNLIEEKNNN